MFWRTMVYRFTHLYVLAVAAVIAGVVSLGVITSCAPVGGILEPSETAEGVTMRILYRSDTGATIYQFYDPPRQMNCWIAVTSGGTALDCEPAERGDR